MKTSTFQIPKFEIYISNGSFCIFYSNLSKTFFILKMSKKICPDSKWAPFKYSTWKFSSQIDHIVFFTQLCAKLSLYSEWPNETKKPFKCQKWKFLSQIDHIVFFTQLCAKLSLYSEWPNETKKPFKCQKWKFSRQIDSGVFVSVITRNFFFYIKIKNR